MCKYAANCVKDFLQEKTCSDEITSTLPCSDFYLSGSLTSIFKNQIRIINDGIHTEIAYIAYVKSPNTAFHKKLYQELGAYKFAGTH